MHFGFKCTLSGSFHRTIYKFITHSKLRIYIITVWVFRLVCIYENAWRNKCHDDEDDRIRRRTMDTLTIPLWQSIEPKALGIQFVYTCILRIAAWRQWMNRVRREEEWAIQKERERESKRINITKNTFPILMHLYGFLLLLYQNKNPTMQCFCFYMHHCGHCVRHLEGSYEFISEWKQKRNFRSVFWSSRSLILAHDFSRLSAKKNLLLYFGYSIQSNATAAPPTRWKLEEFPKADLHHANKIQHQMWKYRMNRTYKRTERTESMDESLTRSNARNSNLKSQREKNHNYKAREKKKKLCVSNEYYVLSNLGSVILLSYIQTLIRIKQHRLLLGVCVCVYIMCVNKSWKNNNSNNSPAMYPVFVHTSHVTSVCNGNHIFYLFNTNPPR